MYTDQTFNCVINELPADFRNYGFGGHPLHLCWTNYKHCVHGYLTSMRKAEGAQVKSIKNNRNDLRKSIKFWLKHVRV